MSTQSEDESFCQTPKFSGTISAIIRPDGKIMKTMDLGEVTKHDPSAMLDDISKKIEFVETIVEIMILKYQKYSVENKNMHVMIKMAKKELQQQLSQCKQSLINQVTENEKLLKELQNIQNDKKRWKQGFKMIGKQKHKEYLRQLDKNHLVQEVIKLMYCLKSLEKKKEEKEKQLEEFRRQQKQRYDKFLNTLRQHQK